MTNTVAVLISAALAKAKLAIAIEKVNRWPSGTSGGRGGQFAPTNGGGGGGSGRAGRGASLPAPPDLSRYASNPTVNRLRTRMANLHRMGEEGNIDGIRAMTTSRTHPYWRMLDDHRTALINAIESGPSRAPVPDAPNIMGANPNNSALLSARRHVERLSQIARDDANPLEALRNYSMGAATNSATDGQRPRTNVYQAQAIAFRAALIQHFSEGEQNGTVSTAPASEQAIPPVLPAVSRAARRARATPQAEPAPQAAPTPPKNPRRLMRDGEAFKFAPNVTNTIVASRTLEDVAMDRQIASNRFGVSPKELGFIPRPNIPLTDRVTLDGVAVNNRGLVRTWDEYGARNNLTANQTAQLAALTRAYLAQNTSLQTRARNYQEGTYVPETPELRAVRLENEARQRAEAQQRIRQAAEAEARLRASIPDAFRTANPIGANVTSATANLRNSRFTASAFTSRAGLEEFSKRIIADYGVNTKFTTSAKVDGGTATISYQGNDGTKIRRDFSVNQAGEISVYHAFFRAGNRGTGAGKRFFRASMGEYIAAGVKKVTVTANIDVGGYAWARFGYLPATQQTWDQLRSTLKAKLEAEYGRGSITKETKAKMARILNETDTRALWKVSDFVDNGRKLGKDLLLGTYWSGKIDLTNGEQMRRFTEYVSQD